MAMIPQQYMFGLCYEMFGKFKVIVVICLLLPCYITSSSVRKRRRPGLDAQIKDASDAFPDQVALATSYLPSNLISSSYEAVNRNPAPSSNLRHNGLLVNVAKDTQDGVNYGYFDPTLADAKTAQDYVMKALQMHAKAETSKNNRGVEPMNKGSNIPRTSFAKYEVYESNEAQQREQPNEPVAIEEESVTRSSYDKYEVSPNNDDDYQRTQDSYTSYSTERYEPDYQIPTYVDYHPPRSHKERPHDGYLQESASEMPKAEILRHIEESVIKYIRALEAEGRIPPPTSAPKKQSHHSTEQSLRQNGKIKIPVEAPYKTQMPRPTTASPESYYNPTLNYAPGNPMQNVLENFDENIEFVYRNKARALQKTTKHPISSTTPNFNHVEALKSLQEFDAAHVLPEEPIRPSSRPKLYFNSETYHDINSLPYKPEKEYRSIRPKENYIRAEHRGLPERNFNEREQENVYIPIGEQHVQQKGVKDSYLPIRSYEYSVHQHAGPSYSDNSISSAKPTDWHPYIPSNQNTSPAPTSNSYAPDALPYDSYSPKYNNNPEGFGYQQNYKVPDMYGTPSSSRPSKTTSSSYTKRGKRGGYSSNSTMSPNKTSSTKNSKSRKNRDAVTDLKPPPYFAKEQNY